MELVQIHISKIRQEMDTFHLDCMQFILSEFSVICGPLYRIGIGLGDFHYQEGIWIPHTPLLYT